MCRFTVFTVLLTLFFCSCNLFRSKGGEKESSQPTVKVQANSIALNVRMDGEDLQFLSTTLEEMLFGALKARGFSVVKGLEQPTELVLDANLQLKEGERKRIYGPDKFTYRVEGVWKLLKRTGSVLILHKELSREAVQLGREAAVRAVVQMVASEIVGKVSETVSRPMGFPHPRRTR